MTNDISRKLQAEFNIPIERESQVVYILVEVRKLLTSERVSGYVTLKFFCDWALHTKLQKRNAGLLLQPFDEAYGRRGPDGMLEQDQQRLGELISLIEFTREFKEVLAAFDIKPHSLVGPDAWFRFIEIYLSVIKDSGLHYEAREIPLRFVNQVIVERYEVPEEVQALRPDMYLPFGIAWRFSWNDQHVFSWPMPFGAYRM
jgi:hypothetical protein